MVERHWRDEPTPWRHIDFSVSLVLDVVPDGGFRDITNRCGKVRL